MEKLRYWLARWTLIEAAVVFVLLAHLSQGPWFISASLILGVSILAMVIAPRERSRPERRFVLIPLSP